MKILAIETSTDACSIALVSGKELMEEHQVAAHRQGVIILASIEALLGRANLGLSGLDAIAFGCGPGAFTGLRIAASVTQGLALAADLPVIPVSSLQVIAQTVFHLHGHSNIVVALDTRMNEVYSATFSFPLSRKDHNLR